jgi:hypothetical protein
VSLKTDYFDGLTGLHQKEIDAFNAGVAFVAVTNLTAISTELTNAASAGKTAFTVTLVTSYSPTILKGNRGDNLILKSYLAGVQKGLSDQGVFDFECSPTLNMSDPLLTKIDLNFNFQTT